MHHIEEPGRQYAINFDIININGYNDNYCNILQKGYKIIVHNPDEYPSRKLHSNIIAFDT